MRGTKKNEEKEIAKRRAIEQAHLKFSLVFPSFDIPGNSRGIGLPTVAEWTSVYREFAFFSPFFSFFLLFLEDGG